MKRTLSLLLAVLMVLSLFTAMSVTAGAEETDAPAEIAAADDAELSLEETAEEEITDEETGLVPVAAEPETEVPTEPAAQAPTEAQTEAPTEPTVGRVKNISRDSYESDSCLLNWDPVEGATGYYVYYLNADNHKNFSRYADVDTNSCWVRKLRQGTQYHFKVSAYIEYDGKIIEGETTLKKTATQPAKVTGLTKWRSSTVLEIDWDRNEKATGYRIYRKEGSGAEVLYTTIRGNSTTTFSDTDVTQGETYRYRVKSFRELYDTSYSSDAASMTFIAGLCGPNYSITSRLGRVNLSWNKNPYATHYEVYMSTSPDNSTFELQFTTPRLYYNTPKLPVGNTYYFRVRSIYKSGSTVIEGTSNKKSATITDTAYGEYVGDTYIEVSIDQQHMWAYKDGRQVVTTEVVTGNYGTDDTPTGYYEIEYKVTDTYLVGDTWNNHVDYWMPFYGGYGIHDSDWRSEYGNPIYKGDGSHGCVNTPIGAMSKLYDNMPTGTPVIIY